MSQSLCSNHSERISRLEDLMLKFASEQAQMHADLKGSLARIEDKMDCVSDQVSNVEKKVESLEEKLDSTVARVGHLEASHKSSEKRMKAIKKLLWGAAGTLFIGALESLSGIFSKMFKFQWPTH